MKKPRILITGVGGGAIGGQIFKCLDMIGNYQIFTANSHPRSHFLYKSCGSVILPSAKSKEYIVQTLDACKKFMVDCLIPGSEPEMEICSEYRDRFEKKGVVPIINNIEVIRICQNKIKTMRFLEKEGFDFPQTKIVNSSKNSLSFPLILKPYIGAGGSKDTFFITDKEEFELYCKLFWKKKKKIIVQEYKGDPSSEYTIGVLHTLQGNFLGIISIKRLFDSAMSVRDRVIGTNDNSYLVSSGISQGYILKNKILEKTCSRIAEKLGSKGPLNIQCRIEGSTVYPFEINPRFSGTEFLRAICGFNAPHALVQKELFDNKIPMTYNEGLVLRGLQEFLIPIKKLQHLQDHKILYQEDMK